LLVAASLISTLLMALTLWVSRSINRFMGKTSINVISSLMALIVSAIGIDRYDWH
jgi:small neutral amino acid transporter SnatA (MarC family)